jgi:hypothetical protein
MVGVIEALSVDDVTIVEIMMRTWFICTALLSRPSETHPSESLGTITVSIAELTF